MTTLANLDEIVPTEDIEKFIEQANLAPPTALALADTGVAGKGTGNNLQFPRFDGITIPAGTKVENAEFTAVATTLSAANLSGGWVGFRDQVSWEAETHAVRSAVEAVVANGVPHLRNRVDSDGFVALAGATNNSSFAGLALTDDRVLTAMSAFAAQHPNPSAGGTAIAINLGQHLDWAQDLNANGGNQLGGDAESERVATLMGPREGFVGVRHGAQVFVSSNVQTAGADAEGAILKIGKNGPLVYRSWHPITFESDWLLRAKAWDVVVATYYGYTIRNQSNLRGLISLAT